MNKILAELLEIPEKAMDVLQAPTQNLPLKVPYLGMGSSYFSPLAFKYLGIEIYPEIASEYFNYLSVMQKKPFGVILSQSGKSSEALWCRQLFDSYVAITNYPEHPLGTSPNASTVIPLLAGPEFYSSSKTFVNTLIVLYKGLGFNPSKPVEWLIKKFDEYQEEGKKLAHVVYSLISEKKIHGIYITGSGPNIATALEAALVMSESTMLSFQGLPMAQYDHGPKETAKDSIVIQILSRGKSYERTLKLGAVIKAAGAHVFTVGETEIEEHYSMVPNIVTFNFAAYFLAEKLGVGEPFSVGGKITEV